MGDFKPLGPKDIIIVPPGYHKISDLTPYKDQKVDKKGNPIGKDFKGREYVVIGAAEKKFSGAAQFGRRMLGVLLAISIVCLPLFAIKGVRGLFSDRMLKLYGKPIPEGIKNMGNTCYFNSSIQTLFAMPGFRECVARKDPKESELIKALQDLMKDWDEEKDAKTLGQKVVKLFKMLVKYDRTAGFDQTRLGDQQDPMVLIMALADAIGYQGFNSVDVITPAGYESREDVQPELALMVPTRSEALNFPNLIVRLKEYKNEREVEIFKTAEFEKSRHQVEQDLKNEAMVNERASPIDKALGLLLNGLLEVNQAKKDSIEFIDFTDTAAQLRTIETQLQNISGPNMEGVNTQLNKAKGGIEIARKAFESTLVPVDKANEILTTLKNQLQTIPNKLKEAAREFQTSAEEGLSTLRSTIEKDLNEHIKSLQASPPRDTATIIELQNFVSAVTVKPIDVQKMINDYVFGEEQIEPLERDGRKVPATRRAKMGSYPDQLMIQMLRWEAIGVGAPPMKSLISKDDRDLLLPADGRLQIGDWIYTIEGYIVHHGKSANSGHYWAERLVSGKDEYGTPITRWVQMDDHRVNPDLGGPRNLKKAYILQLKKTEPVTQSV